MSINASFIKPKWCICLFERLFYMKWWVGEKKKKNERLDRPVKIIICRPRVFCCRLLAGHHHSVVDLSCLYRVPTRPEKPWKPGILSFTFWGMQNDWNFLKKWETSGILTQTLKKIISKFGVSKFNWQDVINLQKEKKKNLCHIYITNTKTMIQSQIDLGFHCIYLEITWKIHEIVCHLRSGNPVLWWRVGIVVILFLLILMFHLFSFLPFLHSVQITQVIVFRLVAHHCLCRAPSYSLLYIQVINPSLNTPLVLYPKLHLKIETHAENGKMVLNWYGWDA